MPRGLRIPRDPRLPGKIGHEIRELRCRQCLTQDQLGEKTGFVGGPAIAAYEQGRTCPSVEALIAIAGALGVGVADLLP